MQGEDVNESLLTAAGKNCYHVGEVTLVWDHALKELVDKQAVAEEVTELPKDLATEQRLLELKDEADVILNKRIIYTEEPIKARWYKSTEIMERLTERIRTWTQADIGMLNAGLLISGFSKGDITSRDVHKTCPHPINICTVRLTGDELWNVVNDAFSSQLIELKLKGFGFRGEVIGRMVFANLNVETAFHEHGEEYVVDVLFNNSPLQSDKVYHIATADMFTFGRLLPDIANAPVHQLFLPEFIRALLVGTLLDWADEQK